MNPTIDYNGQRYILLPESEDRQGAGSIKDLSYDFAFDIATDLKIRYGSTEFNEVIRIIRKAFYRLMVDGVFSSMSITPSTTDLPLYFPTQDEVIRVWLS